MGKERVGVNAPVANGLGLAGHMVLPQGELVSTPPQGLVGLGGGSLAREYF